MPVGKHPAQMEHFKPGMLSLPAEDLEAIRNAIEELLGKGAGSEYQLDEIFEAVIDATDKEDYTDERYWIKRIHCKTTTGDIDSQIEFEAETGSQNPYAFQVTATNLAELPDHTHKLQEGDLVRVWVVHDAAARPKRHYVFLRVPVKGFWVKVTGWNYTYTGYEWEEQEPDGSGGLQQKTDGLSGDGEKDILVEVNGNPIPDDEYVWVYNIDEEDAEDGKTWYYCQYEFQGFWAWPTAAPDYEKIDEWQNWSNDGGVTAGENHILKNKTGQLIINNDKVWVCDIERDGSTTYYYCQYEFPGFWAQVDSNDPDADGQWGHDTGSGGSSKWTSSAVTPDGNLKSKNGITVPDGFYVWVCEVKLNGTDREYWCTVPDTVIPVSCTKDGGSAGDEDNDCSFTYTISPVFGSGTLDTDLTPKKDRYPKTTYKQSGGYGLAVYTDGSWELLIVYSEIPDPQTC